jgi:hypothetical protein
MRTTRSILRRLSVLLVATVLMVSCSSGNEADSGSIPDSAAALLEKLAAPLSPDSEFARADLPAAVANFPVVSSALAAASAGAALGGGSAVTFDGWSVASPEEWRDGIGVSSDDVQWVALVGSATEQSAALTGAIEVDPVVDAITAEAPDAEVTTREGWTFIDQPGEDLRPYQRTSTPMNTLGRPLHYAVQPGWLIVSTRAGHRDAMVATITSGADPTFSDLPAARAVIDVMDTADPDSAIVESPSVLFEGSAPQGLALTAELLVLDPAPNVTVLLAYDSEAQAEAALEHVEAWRSNAARLRGVGGPVPVPVWTELQSRREGTVVIVDVAAADYYGLVARALVSGLICTGDPEACG